MKRIKRFFGFMGRHFFNVRRWSSYDFLKGSAQDIYRSGKSVFKSPQVKKPESFDAALNRLDLNEADLQARYQNCQRVFYTFAAITVALVLYTIYLLCTGVIMGAILAFVVTALVGVHAFKYHFWMFQIKHRKLGCSFSEWKSGHTKEEHKASSHE